MANEDLDKIALLKEYPILLPTKEQIIRTFLREYPETSYEELATKLNTTVKYIQKIVSTTPKEHPLKTKLRSSMDTMTQVIEVLCTSKKELSRKEIAEKATLSKVYTTMILDKLELKEYVNKTRKGQRFYYQATEKGMKFWKERKAS